MGQILPVFACELEIQPMCSNFRSKLNRYKSLHDISSNVSVAVMIVDIRMDRAYRSIALDSLLTKIFSS